MSILDALIGLLAPYNCLGCGFEGVLLCRTCTLSLRPPQVTVNPPSLSRVQSVTAYSGLAKSLVWQLKSSGAQTAAKVMVNQMLTYVDPNSADIIAPIPTATKRVRQRGYDQARLLAREMANQSGIVWVDCLAWS